MREICTEVEGGRQFPCCIRRGHHMKDTEEREEVAWTNNVRVTKQKRTEMKSRIGVCGGVFVGWSGGGGVGGRKPHTRGNNKECLSHGRGSFLKQRLFPQHATLKVTLHGTLFLYDGIARLQQALVPSHQLLTLVCDFMLKNLPQQGIVLHGTHHPQTDGNRGLGKQMLSSNGCIGSQ